ncbi:MAG: hypothetical protein A2W80_10055 [Candidatus Riflebacteria bacterium GWC2_50_8]|nr:MAG: hypothetical protein A2W80_10055 [Candidatus Riflebacteria bacterium GWC2_50_8]
MIKNFLQLHVRKIATNANRKAITLLEIAIALAITTIIAVPLLYLYQSGLRSSTSGVVSIDMLSEGRRICSQIHDDLKNSCIPYRGGFGLRFSDLLEADFSRAAGLAGAEYRLYRHTTTPELLKKTVSGQRMLLRPIMHVRYRLEKMQNSDLLKLVRIESLDGAPERIKVLSERVSLLKIQPVKIADDQSYLWNVKLQLAYIPERIQTEISFAASDRGQGVLISDFYDVVYSDFFKSVSQNPLAPRNWHTGLTFQRN